MYIDHVGINTNDMEATLQFYCGILGMRLVRTTRTPDGRRHYNVEIGGGNAFAVFDGAELPTAGERQHMNHLALPVETPEEFDAAYQRLKDHGVAVTEIIERGYGKTFYFDDPNGIRLQIELKTKQDAASLEGDPDPVPYVRALLQRFSAAQAIIAAEAEHSQSTPTPRISLDRAIKLSGGEDLGDRLSIRARAVRRDSRERAAARAHAGGNARRLGGR